MKTFQSFGALARALDRQSMRLEDSLAAAMKASAGAVQATAKAEIGTYQTEDMGPFAEWAPLAASTVEEKRRLGYADEENDNPLLRRGDLRDSIGAQSDFRSFVVGNPMEIAVYQELGTSRGLPPRPFLAPALYRNVPVILANVGEYIERVLAGVEK